MKADYHENQPARQQPDAVHPAGSKARVLLTSVFGPYAQDDEYGSRTLNPMELYHNQVTRMQGPFSLRMFHRSWGLMLIQANIEAPCTLLDFPDAGSVHRGDPHAPVRRRRHQLDHAEPGQGQEDVRADPPVPARTRRSSSAGTSPTSPTCTTGSTPTTSSGARASAGSARFLGEDAEPPDPPPA